MRRPHPLRALWRTYVGLKFLQGPQPSDALDVRRARVQRRDRARRWAMRGLIVAGVGVLLVGLPWLLVRGPYVIDGKYIDKGELAKGSAALVTGLRTAVVAFAAALGASIALLYTARTYRLTRRGQITDRFTKALERLGSTEIYVRIGGILALEQIVQDAPEQAATDAARVLGHFIRDRTPKALPTHPPTGSPDPPTSSSDVSTPDSDDRADELPADVQAALTALTRTESRPHVDPREQLDLRELHLARAKLNKADLTEVNLSETTLTEANLSEAMLMSADLRGARLTRTDLFQTKLTRADLSGATLTDADLLGATLTRADLSEATLTRARLCGAALTEANLSEAILTETDLRMTDLSRVRGLTVEQAVSAVTNKSTRMPAWLYPTVGSTSALRR
ncbi:pentapeptide repeat-containing protein [Streptomyces sp. NPDC092369]|uniref:pentapeptide repeat-containing protein n=1 Tax=Streptomyces sp. NPDC092369 TaxID=3366015 RepID=UPI0038092111